MFRFLRILDWLAPLFPWLLLALLIDGRFERSFPGLTQWPWFEAIAGSFLFVWWYCLGRLWMLSRVRHAVFTMRGLYLALAWVAGTLPSLISLLMLSDRRLDAIAGQLLDQLAPGAVVNVETTRRTYGFDNDVELVYTLATPLDKAALQQFAGRRTDGISFYIKSDEDALLMASYEGEYCGHCQAYFSMGPKPNQLTVAVSRF